RADRAVVLRADKRPAWARWIPCGYHAGVIRLPDGEALDAIVESALRSRSRCPEPPRHVLLAAVRSRAVGHFPDLSGLRVRVQGSHVGMVVQEVEAGPCLAQVIRVIRDDIAVQQLQRAGVKQRPW